MKNKTITLAILVLVLLSVTVLAMAQTLPVDTRKKVANYHKTFTALRYAPAADTSWHRITLPARCTEVTILPVTGAIGVRPDSVYTNAGWFDVAAGVPITVPTWNMTTLWIRRAAAGTASIANLLFRRH